MPELRVRDARIVDARRVETQLSCLRLGVVGMSADEWEFQPGEMIRERHEHHAPEYKIKRQLRGESDGKRFYHVEKEEGGTHLYSAGAIEGRYEVVAEGRGSE